MGAFTIMYDTEIKEKLDEAISNAMENEVQRTALNIIEESATKRIYQAYSPKFVSRRGLESVDAGYECEPSGNSLTITSIAPMQNLYGGDKAADLGDAIAEGWGNYNMPFPRPWIEDDISQRLSELENALAAGMQRQGF